MFFFFKQKTAYEILAWLEFRRVLFRSADEGGSSSWRYNFSCASPRFAFLTLPWSGLSLHLPHTRCW